MLNKIFESTDEPYCSWIKEHRPFIFPPNVKTSYEEDILVDPQRYLPCMIYMCRHLESLRVKSFQFFPLRTNIIPKYIPIDTRTSIQLFENINPQYEKNLEENKEFLWNKYFYLDSELIFYQSNYAFDHRITTDCFAVSL